MYRAVRLAVISQTTMSYFNVLGFKKQLQVLEQMIQDMEEQRKYTAIQYHKGAISKVELLNIEERIEYFKREIPKVQQSIKVSENALALLTNRKINTIQTQDVFEKINHKQIILYNLPSSILKQRPDVLAAENELKKYNAQVAQAISALLPTVNITALLNNFGFYLGNFVSFTTNIIQGQLSAVMPLVDGSVYGDIKKAKAVEYAAIYHYLGALTLAIADIDTAMASRNNSLIGLGHIQRAEEKTKAQLQLGRIQYETGAISYLEYLNYKVNNKAAKLKLVQYQQVELNSTVRLYQALAGGSCIENDSKRSSSKLKA
jgi:outer membrane protein TolC